MGKVALVKTHDRVHGVNQLFDLLELDPMNGRHVFLKPNWNSADPPPGSTHNDTLSTIILRLQALNAGRITVGDRSGMGNTRAVMESKGIPELTRELGVDTVALDELDAGGWQHIDAPGSHWRRGFAVARPAIEADLIVQTCCLKTHRYGGHATLSLKNSVGLVAERVPGDSYNYMSELHNSPHQRLMIAEINTAYTPALVLLDGVVAFVDGGPDHGTLVDARVMLASADRIAIDAVGVALLRMHGTTPAVSRGTIFQQEQIARAVQLGLGITTPNEIRLVTMDQESAALADQIREMLSRT